MTPANFLRWREHMGFSQRAAAEALGISESSVRLYEAGERRGSDRRTVVIPKTVELACAALGLGIKRYTGPQ